MAKESVIARQKKREALVQRYAAKRKQLKQEGNYQALDKLPKNASPVRLRNRCKITGRARGYMGEFTVSRIIFRDWAAKGFIPGVIKTNS